MALPIADVTFFGFRLLARRPLSILAWGAVGFVALVALILAVGVTAAVMGYQPAAAGAAPPPPAGAGALFAGLASIAGFILVWAMFLAAAYRMTLRPEDRGFAYLRYGMAELRLALLTAVIVIGTMGLWFLGFVLQAILSEAGAGAVAILTWLGLICLWALLAVRLSLAGAVSFAEGGFGLVRSWILTRGEFWPLFCVYLILAILWVAATIVTSMVGFTIQMLSGFGAMAAAGGSQADPTAVGGGFLLGALVVLVLNLFVWASEVAVLYAPHAEAYRRLSGETPEKTSEIFA